MKILSFLPGHMLVEITCADAAALLNALNARNIPLRDVIACDDLTLRIRVDRCVVSALTDFAPKYGANIRVLHTSGIYAYAEQIFRRPVLVAFCVLLLFLGCYLPGKVFFISVEGNTTLAGRYILEVAAECGIRFGAQRRQVRSEAMKNLLLEKIPELQWAGINTSGCTATITVREKTKEQEMTQKLHSVASIVATRDGIIQNCTVYQGNPLCAVGQAVKAGQTLVSGYLDCGILTKAVQAEADIRALTFRELEVIAPVPTAKRGGSLGKSVSYGLRIGKKHINFTKDSGNSDAVCGKMYSEEYVYLPGGFRLPVAIIRETVFYYEEDTGALAGSGDWMADFAQAYLKAAMISGEIISAQVQTEKTGGADFLYGKFACVEMIGQVRREAQLPKDDNNDRTNR